jgi:hypothetical protein
MTRNEMNRRLATIADRAELRRAHRMVLEGYGGNGMKHETNLTVKQINAVFEWVSRYGRIVPTPLTGEEAIAAWRAEQAREELENGDRNRAAAGAFPLVEGR